MCMYIIQLTAPVLKAGHSALYIVLYMVRIRLLLDGGFLGFFPLLSFYLLVCIIYFHCVHVCSFVSWVSFLSFLFSCHAIHMYMYVYILQTNMCTMYMYMYTCTYLVYIVRVHVWMLFSRVFKIDTIHAYNIVSVL